MLVDTHAHLDEQAFDEDREAVVDRAIKSGLGAIVTIGTTLQSSQAAVRLAHEFPNVRAVVGIQPNYVAEAGPADWDAIVELARDPQVVGVGETGLDRYWDYAAIDLQRDYFDRHLRLATDLDLPFVVHCRDAEADVVDQLAQFGGPHRGIMHSFCGTADTAVACVEMGMHISFSGMLTYKKNEQLRAVAREIPLDRLLVETDAPYLVPHESRKAKVKRNEPAFLLETNRCLAEVHGISEAEMAKVTADNACKLFRIELPLS